MSLSETQCRFTLALARLILRADELGYAVKIACLNRTMAEQAMYVQMGKSKTLKSAHLENRAADLVLFKDGKPITEGEAFRPLGESWEANGAGFVWGGRFGVYQKDYSSQIGWDCCHFELKGA